MTMSEPQTLQDGWRYSLVGVVCALANYLVMLAVDWVHGHYLLGTLAGFLIVTPLGYLLHSVFTFGQPFSLRSFLLFSATLLAAYPLATGVMAILCSGLHLSVAVAYPIAVVVMFGWNFVSARWAILPRFEHLPSRMTAGLCNRAGARASYDET